MPINRREFLAASVASAAMFQQRITASPGGEYCACSSDAGEGRYQHHIPTVRMAPISSPGQLFAGKAFSKRTLNVVPGIFSFSSSPSTITRNAQTAACQLEENGSIQ